MNELAKQAVIDHVTFKFEPNGRLKVVGRLTATKAYKAAMDGEAVKLELSSALTEIERAIVELTGIGFTEAIAALAFSAGARTVRDKAMAAGQSVDFDIPKPTVVPDKEAQKASDANQVDPNLLKAQVAYERLRRKNETKAAQHEADRIKSQYQAIPNDQFDTMSHTTLILLARKLGVQRPEMAIENELREAVRQAYNASRSRKGKHSDVVEGEVVDGQKALPVQAAVMPDGEPDVPQDKMWWRGMNRDTLIRLAIDEVAIERFEAEGMMRVDLIRAIRKTRGE